MLQVETHKIEFPAPVIHKCTIIHPAFELLKDYVDAKKLEQRIVSLMDRHEHAAVMAEAEKAKDLLENVHMANDDK